jgi:multiple sugar transport system permease protein
MKTGMKKMSREKRDNIIGYSLIAPSLILLIAIGIIPILITVSYSFQYRVLTDPLNTHFVGFENYITLFKSETFLEVLRNTAVFTVLSMVFQLIVGFAGALLMNGAKRFVGIIRTAVLIPWAIPGIIIAYMFSFMFNDQLGVMNQLFRTANIISSPVAWLTDRTWAMVVVVLADTWKQFPYIALMLLAGLQTIPKELYESAAVDGAGRISKFFRITLPNLKGVILIILLFRTMGAIRIFDIIFGITGGGPANSTATLLYQAYKYLFGDMNFGLGSALSTIITILILACSIIYIKVLKTDD